MTDRKNAHEHRQHCFASSRHDTAPCLATCTKYMAVEHRVHATCVTGGQVSAYTVLEQTARMDSVRRRAGPQTRIRREAAPA